MKNILLIVSLVMFVGLVSCKSKKEVVDQTSEVTDMPDGVLTALDKLVATVGVEGKKEDKFRSIYNKYLDKRMEVKKQGGKPSKMAKEVLILRDKQNAEMKKILTDEQYQIYLEAIEDSKGRPQLQKNTLPDR